MPRLRVHGSCRFLCDENGDPFFWLGDTAWSLFQKLTMAETAHYLRTRADQGFNVIQAVALGELDGIESPNASGRLPLRRNDAGSWDPAMPDLDGADSYWDHVDAVIDLAAGLGLVIALLPTWGDKVNKGIGRGPEIFTVENARVYGEWLGRRYRDRDNIVWVLGGDRDLSSLTHYQVWEAMGLGLRAGDDARHLITLHPQGLQSSSPYFHDRDWMDFHMIQSCHCRRDTENYEFVRRDYELPNPKPTIDAEPCYEDHPIDFESVDGYFDAVDVRKAAYWAVFAGAFGHTYGHHSVWSVSRGSSWYFPVPYEKALMRPGATQMRHLKDLMLSLPFFERVPDQSMVVSDETPDGDGALGSNLALVDPRTMHRPTGTNHVAATRGSNFALFYIPHGLDTKVRLGAIEGDRVRARWFDPRSGRYTEIGTVQNLGEHVFRPEEKGRGEDVVLRLDSL